MEYLKNPVDVKTIISQFDITGEYLNFEPINVGHINDTILVKTINENDPDYVVQRINHNIFKDVDKLMANIHRVTSHIKKKLAANEKTKNNKYLELVNTNDGQLYYQDQKGKYWRCYVYCKNGSANFDEITPGMAKEGGKALGKFQSLLSDLPGGPLYETIPDFHNLEKRLAAFNDSCQKDVAARVKSVQTEIEFFNSRADDMLKIHRLGKQGLLPVRITHNDTKFNNILFDENAKALCIIDLDTVMNGYVHYDFGDAIRTLANTAEEDEADLSKVNFDFELFENFSRGYLEETLSILTETEIKYLAFSAKLMTYIIALRFFTDFLSGDTYFKTNYPNHNLDRTRNQMQLLKMMEEGFSRMEGVIESFSITSGQNIL